MTPYPKPTLPADRNEFPRSQNPSRPFFIRPPLAPPPPPPEQETPTLPAPELLPEIVAKEDPDVKDVKPDPGNFIILNR